MKYFGYIVGLVFILSACNSSSNKTADSDGELNKSITELEAELFGSDENKIDRKKAVQLVDLYTEFANTYPDDSLAPEYLYKAADISMNMRRPIQTIELFDQILNEYPDFDKAPTVLFLKAFVYEDQMNDYDRASQYYKLFLKKYPDNEFADDAEVSLKNLGKTPEELIKEFEENSQSTQ